MIVDLDFISELVAECQEGALEDYFGYAKSVPVTQLRQVEELLLDVLERYRVVSGCLIDCCSSLEGLESSHEKQRTGDFWKDNYLEYESASELWKGMWYCKYASLDLLYFVTLILGMYHSILSKHLSLYGVHNSKRLHSVSHCIGIQMDCIGDDLMFYEFYP